MPSSQRTHSVARPSRTVGSSERLGARRQGWQNHLAQLEALELWAGKYLGGGPEQVTQALRRAHANGGNLHQGKPGVLPGREQLQSGADPGIGVDQRGEGLVHSTSRSLP